MKGQEHVLVDPCWFRYTIRVVQEKHGIQCWKEFGTGVIGHIGRKITGCLSIGGTQKVNQ